MPFTLSYFYFGRPRTCDFVTGFSLSPRASASPGIPSPVVPHTCVPAVLSHGRAGISTCCPSATSFDLALGPAFPRVDRLYPGNLGYSAARILTLLSLLVPAFSLLKNPRALSFTLRLFDDAPLPMLTHPRASAARLSPGHFRRRTSRLVSCYALFECVAASEPTS